MISTLRGSFTGTMDGAATVIDVNGVGYAVVLNDRDQTLVRSRGPGPLTVHTRQIITEHAHTLIGFLSEDERAIFDKIVKVDGLGAGTAVKILSVVSGVEFMAIVAAQDRAKLKTLPGIGDKTVDKLLQLAPKEKTRAPKRQA